MTVLTATAAARPSAQVRGWMIACAGAAGVHALAVILVVAWPQTVPPARARPPLSAIFVTPVPAPAPPSEPEPVEERQAEATDAVAQTASAPGPAPTPAPIAPATALSAPSGSDAAEAGPPPAIVTANDRDGAPNAASFIWPEAGPDSGVRGALRALGCNRGLGRELTEACGEGEAGDYLAFADPDQIAAFEAAEANRLAGLGGVALQFHRLDPSNARQTLAPRGASNLAASDSMRDRLPATVPDPAFPD